MRPCARENGPETLLSASLYDSICSLISAWSLDPTLDLRMLICWPIDRCVGSKPSLSSISTSSPTPYPLRDGVGRLSLIDRMYLEQSLFLPFRKGLLRLLPHDGNLEYLSRFQAFGRVRVVAADRLLVRAVGFTERVERFPGLDRVHVVAFACDRDHALRLPGLRAGPRKAQ